MRKKIISFLLVAWVLFFAQVYYWIFNNVDYSPTQEFGIGFLTILQGTGLIISIAFIEEIKELMEDWR